MHEREGPVVACLRVWKDGSKDQFRIQGGCVGPQVMQSNSQMHRCNPFVQLSLANGVIIILMLRFSRGWWSKLFHLFFSLIITLFLHFSLTHKIFTLFLVSLPSSPLTFVPRTVFCHRLLLLARFQVNQKQIQGRAQPNFGPPWKPWPGPHFYLFPEWQTPDDRACLPVTARVETSDLRPAAAFREFKLAAEISTDTADADSHDCLLV